ncbi:lactate utilization protein C [Planococcus sp. N028]|uniref:Lactate utilization protein C n=1 Tax=Planococcus shixiaomingii TaxID=3058393 RepID=A0ABT8N3I4_9BACL|nr:MULTISPECIES: lactate utilization protein C [unclassified Planococcus (in: firmicutes)]MDN7242120.1 lactate utilization protein C [Planococcus sp. N028]WKA54394.1 lactate utilization protein C [Planococcus sp. N022]
MAEGTIHNKDAFLNRIADKLGRKQSEVVALPAWKHQPQWSVFEDASSDDLLAAFCKSSTAKSVFVKETELANLRETLEEVIKKHGGGPIVTTKDARFSEYGLEQLFSDPETHIWNAALGRRNVELAKQANIGVIFSDISLAESGTIVQFNDRDIARSVSLLPVVYVAIIPKSTIVPRMTQATQLVHGLVKSGKELSTCINFISGPSNSADIEMDIVIGVHGPVEAVHIVVTDK